MVRSPIGECIDLVAVDGDADLFEDADRALFDLLEVGAREERLADD
jgi:hypothetical protein